MFPPSVMMVRVAASAPVVPGEKSTPQPASVVEFARVKGRVAGERNVKSAALVPDHDAEKTWRTEVPVFVTLKFCTAEVVPRRTPPKLIAVREGDATGATPVPERETVGFPLSVAKPSVALSAPEMDGLNWTSHWALLPAAIVAPADGDTRKSAALLPVTVYPVT